MASVLFALFEIPPLLNGFFTRVEPHATLSMLSAPLLVQIYAKAIEIYPRTPSVQSDIVTGPYVKLFIPYMPRRHISLRQASLWRVEKGHFSLQKGYVKISALCTHLTRYREPRSEK